MSRKTKAGETGRPSSARQRAAPAGISACVTHLNEWPEVRSFLQSLVPQLRPQDEVVVVDAGSRGPSREFLEQEALREPRVRLVVEPGAKRGHGRDAAWRAAKNDVILHTDADRTWKADGWQEAIELAKRLDNGPIKLFSRLIRHGATGYVFHRRHLESIRGYDRTLQYFEDRDAEMRLRALGPMQEVLCDFYEQDPKRKMRNIPRAFRYYWDMFFDAARAGNKLSYMVRPSIGRPWRWPFLAWGCLAYWRGRRAPAAKARAAGGRPGS